MTHKFVGELMEASPSSEFSLAIKAYWQVWKSIDAEIKTIEQELQKQAQKDPNEQIYRSAPARIFICRSIDTDGDKTGLQTL